MRRVVPCIVLAVVAATWAGPVAATDDYTRPFYQRTQTMSYGVDRNSATCQQLAWNGSVFNDCNTHYLYVYDNHTGMDYPMATNTKIAAARTGKITFIRESTPDNDHTLPENKVHIEHEIQADGNGLDRTVYAHLAYMSVIPALNALVNAGQWIANSDCTGNCQGAHLHFEFATRTSTSQAWTASMTKDPMYEQRWTTPGNYGRAPFLATYVSESTESTSRYVGEIWTHWVKFRNDGGRPWTQTHPANGRGRLLLAAYDPNTGTYRNSPAYVSSDWLSTSLVTTADTATIAPDATGTFTFKLRAPIVSQTTSFTERFDLLAQSLYWFNYWENPGISGFYIPITSICC